MLKIKLTTAIAIFEAFIKKIITLLNNSIGIALKEIDMLEISLATLKENVEKARRIISKFQGILD